MGKVRKNAARRNTFRNILVLGVIVIGMVATVSFAGQQQSFIQRAATTAVACTSTVSAADAKHIDDVVQGVMAKDAIPGLSIAITKDGKLVYAKGYGVVDKSTGSPVTTASRFRVASVAKPFTSEGVIKLVRAGKIGLDQKVFGRGSILGTTYTSRPKDSRINNITVRQLLTHTAGMWTNDGNDPMFQNLSLSQSQLIKYTLETRTLPSAPGSKYAYSNFGYLVLGRVIEKVTGQSYEQWIKANVMTPAGITSMQIAGSTKAERASNEVVYYAGGAHGNNPYGINVRRMDSHGGWIGTPTDLVRFMVRMDGFSPPTDLLTASDIQLITTPTSQSLQAIGNNIGYGMGWNVRPDTHAWWHDGVLAGTTSIVVRRPEGFTWAVLANTDGTSTALDIDQMMYNATNGVTSWPNCDQFTSTTSVPTTEVSPEPTYTTIGGCQTNSSCSASLKPSTSLPPVTSSDSKSDNDSLAVFFYS